MFGFFYLDDLSAAEIRALLAADAASLSEDQIIAVADFVRRIGGVANALAAVEMLEQLEEAA